MTGHRVRAYVGIGANLGDSAATLAAAIGALDKLNGASVRRVSRLYATEPVGGIDQPEFRNAVIALNVVPPGDSDHATAALDLLASLKRLEREFGRRPRQRWGPRELDLDLLVFGRARLEIERPPEARSVDAASDPAAAAKLLVVPHPATETRLFVLAPFADLAPRLVPPGWGRTVETARRERLADEGQDSVRPIATWDSGGGAWRPLQPR